MSESVILSYNRSMDNKDFIENVTVYPETDKENREILVYDSGNALQSACYTDYDMRYRLVFEYMKQFDRALKLNPDARKILLLGGAAYAYPKHIISQYPNISVDVVEIDPMAYSTARQFFYLDELIREYDLDNTHRLTNHVCDAYDYIYQCKEKYDIIINDVFRDLEPVYSLMTLSSLAQMKTLLNPEGFYVANLSGYRKHQDTEYLLDELKTLTELYNNVQLFKAFNYPYTKTGNYIILASDTSETLDDRLTYKINDSEIINGIKTVEEKFHKFMYR